MRRARHDIVASSKPLVWIACLLPLAVLAWRTWTQTLGPDPVAQLEHSTGDWALRLLLATLAVSPLKRLTGWAPLLRYRRLLGLFAFFYACVHLAVYLVIDLGGFWRQILGEIVKKPYITVGFLAWLLLIPLAATSTRGAMRRLGRRWGRLHKLVYPVGVLAVLHFAWQVKFGNTIAQVQPVIYGAILVALLAWRLPWRRMRLRSGSAAAARSPVRATPQ
jgi:sulfoxide reductase heme-binding subunit YedZ